MTRPMCQLMFFGMNNTCAETGERREEEGTGGTINPQACCNSPAEDISKSGTVCLMVAAVYSECSQCAPFFTPSLWGFRGE